MGILKDAGKNVTEFSGIMSNPTYDKVQEGAKLAQDNDIDFILAVGGGSVIDCCKIVSAQAKLDEDIWDFEYARGGKPTEFIPMGAIVTAFGTGAEMNNGAVITNTDKMMKSPVWGAFYDFAILDPVYTMTMPMKQVISGAFDSLSHSMETYMGSPREVNLADEINEIRIIGGEPFMNRQWQEIAQKISLFKNINRIMFYTNGTICPKEEDIKKLDREKSFFIITDYGKLSRNIDRMCEILINNGIKRHATRVAFYNTHDNPLQIAEHLLAAGLSLHPLVSFRRS
jgi:hypothetical protein